MDPLTALAEQGQSVWLTSVRRRMIADGELADLVDGGIRGVTHNASVLARAIAGSNDYDEALRDLLDADPHASVFDRYEALAVEDARAVADILRVVYDASAGADGYVGLAVSPAAAHDTEATIAEARRLWDGVDRPNLMIEVPATREGVAALEVLVAAGINVNATLICSVGHYEAVARAYLRALNRTPDPAKVASVASFCLNRIDGAVHPQLETQGSEAETAPRGRIAVAGARLAYRRYRELFLEGDFTATRRLGARPQRLLWADGGGDPTAGVHRVEELIGPETVSALAAGTLAAWRDRGKVRGATILEDVGGAESDLADLGIDVDTLADRLQDEGVRAAADALDRLLAALEEKAARLGPQLLDRQALALGRYRQRVDARLRAWTETDALRRLWAKDPTLWSSEPIAEIADRLGWLGLPVSMHDRLGELLSFADEIRADGIRHVVLLGMGGSSLAPEVFQRTFGSWDGYPELIVLDSTHPEAIRSTGDRIDPATTLFVVSSKSGTTIEPLSLFAYFWEETAAVSGDPGRHFAAVTDPGSPLVELAVEHGFRRFFEAIPDVGGRYSALTHFGLVPAALIGADVHRLLDRAGIMAKGSAPASAPDLVPGIVLGAALGELAAAGRDKLTLAVSSTFAAYPGWIEQLVAESTGKGGRGILPVAGEPLGPPEVYGDDRVFMSLTLLGDDVHDGALAALEAAGHPVIRITVDEPEDLGSEMYRAELATAMAGAVLGVHPFNQPDVQRAKELAQRALAGDLGSGTIPETPAHDRHRAGRDLSELLAEPGGGGYVALQAFLSPTPAVARALQRIRMRIRDRFRVATTVGFGPRFLHSTGQFHKGGPDSGVFIQIVDRPPSDLSIPGSGHSFASLLRGQADGDFQALRDAGRRIIRLSLGGDVKGGLRTIESLLDH